MNLKNKIISTIAAVGLAASLGCGPDSTLSPKERQQVSRLRKTCQGYAFPKPLWKLSDEWVLDQKHAYKSRKGKDVCAAFEARMLYIPASVTNDILDQTDIKPNPPYSSTYDLRSIVREFKETAEGSNMDMPTVVSWFRQYNDRENPSYVNMKGLNDMEERLWLIQKNRSPPEVNSFSTTRTFLQINKLLKYGISEEDISKKERPYLDAGIPPAWIPEFLVLNIGPAEGKLWWELDRDHPQIWVNVSVLKKKGVDYRTAKKLVKEIEEESRKEEIKSYLRRPSTRQ